MEAIDITSVSHADIALLDAALRQLAGYHDNAAARSTYERMGFAAQAGEMNMILAGAAYETLKETA